MTQDFEFEDAGQKFICSVEAPSHAGMAPWWWFRLESEERTRYAPFEASAKDTKRSVQERIVAYYEELLVIRARPVHQRAAWQRPVRSSSPENPVPAVSVTQS